jgi:hypothetical protein
MGGSVDSAPACYGSSLGSNPDISQKYKMADMAKKIYKKFVCRRSKNRYASQKCNEVTIHTFRFRSKNLQGGTIDKNLSPCL